MKLKNVFKKLTFVYTQVTIHKVLEHQELPSETTFGCEIEIPGTDYFVR